MDPNENDNAEFELWQFGEPVASASGPRLRALGEIAHYHLVYSPDGPCEVMEVKRLVVDPDAMLSELAGIPS